ncbi:MAG TPA: L-threonylcarbamoyladenylate synthase [Polyangiaceae bacterium LLY-WYZ-15_(1-7)]|nr:threonylcarbamoyl-AMP synthase [Myxococcales bacterium]MAT26997.1 threonylcarbamoyl-AMP synthase [Sandaracinus sp.]HJK93597.1 L-threonylcarbamoyladenylate synthase [Polyangiaceae bacterium LLY-WYZ-15_(1-7)]MBJ70511.1 threonylcarbamoyl-AMP synthase [Sandaracinus sp.]HJL06604.1 L-threonylcarbamoyladenylate synthase [Polyangiaceae bacterium LLY-WYZ-15_(1-7)]
MRLEIHPTHPQGRKVAKTVETLRRGGVIVYPTDTCYALGCDIFQKKAIDRIYRIKQMKKDQPLAFVCPDLGDIARYAVVDNRNYRLMRRLLPGPYTFILPATREVPRILMMKRKTVGIRVPHHEVALEIVRELGNPIVSTSATWEGEQLNDPDDLVDRFKQADLVIDAGWGGMDPSTVLDLTGPEVVVVREGAGPVEGVL